MKIVALLGLLVTLSSFAQDGDKVSGSFGSLGKSSTQKTVFGKYVRNQVIDSSHHMLRIVGEIAVGCTGTLIGPKHILTAAHCVYDQENKKWRTGFEFTPGKTSDGSAPYGKIGWNKILLQQEFIDGDSSFLYDFAVIELSSPIGDTLGWAGYRVLKEEESEHKIKITGYPVDKLKGTMWTVTCPASVVNSIIRHECDTAGGMSGSGTFAQIIHNGTEPHYITGVHVAGGSMYNSAVSLNMQNYTLIRNWATANEYSANTVIKEKQKYNRIYIQNNCRKQITVALSWMKLDDTWSEDGFWSFAPGEKAFMAKTENYTYYIWAQAADRTMTWEGDFYTDYAGTGYHMIEKKITTSEYTDWTHIFTCN